MKRIVLFLMIFAILIFQTFGLNEVYAKSESTYYARAVKTNTCLYRNPTLSQETENIYFVIEPTYFVEVYGLENESFFKASYLGINGYVKRGEIQFVNGTPSTPYANDISFRVFAQNGLNLRSSPADSGGLTNRITTVPFLETNLQYIGKIAGEESVIYRGDTWFFCKYIKNDELFYGYLYAGYCDLVTTIIANTEALSIADEPTFLQNVEQLKEDENTNWVGGLSTPVQTLIIVGVCLPALLIIYLLFRPARIMAEKNQSNSSNSKKRRKRYRGDYYEYDD